MSDDTTHDTTRLTEFERARLERIDDCFKITPVELLKQLIADIESGRDKVDGIVLLTLEVKPDGGWDLQTRRAQISRDRELVMCEMGKERCIRNWINPPIGR